MLTSSRKVVEMARRSARRRGMLMLVCGVVAATPAMGQVVKVLQPWTPLRASFDSIVRDCDDPTPANVIAADDWISLQTGPVIRVAWWGTVETAAQLLNKPFYVAIYQDNGDCGPTQRIYQACVIPIHRRVGSDCEDQPVYRFTALLPNPIMQQVGNRYWLQISEVDQQSARLDVVDWHWSAHWPIAPCTCPAMQRNVIGQINQPLNDPCYGDPDDLAFGLAARSVSGKIDLSLVEEPYILKARFLDPATGRFLEEQCVEPNVDGDYDIWPELPDGTYTMRLHGMGALPVEATVVLTTGVNTVANFTTVKLGDLDGNDVIEAQDLALMLANWLATFP